MAKLSSIARRAITLSLIGASIKAQAQSLSVKITDEAGNVLPAAEVTVDSSLLSLTDEFGLVKDLPLTPGNHVVSSAIDGFEPQTRSFKVETGEVKQFSFILKRDKRQIDNVIVTGKSELTKIREQSYNLTVIDAKKLYNTTADINQVLNRTTGVRVRESGGLGSNFDFNLNGFSGNQVKFFLDGVPMSNFGSSLSLNNIPINIAERIEVYKGVVPVSLGSDALGGAVNIVTNKKIKRYFDASYSFGSFNTHRASVNGRYTSDNGWTLNFNSFLNYSDNNYKVKVTVSDPQTGAFGPEQKLPHFHDAYTSGGLILEGGITGKKYADYLLIGVMASANHKEIQQGINMQEVVGDAFNSSKNLIPTLKYAKENLFVKGLSVNVSSSYLMLEGRSVDTSEKIYDWTGNYTYSKYIRDYAGELGNKTFLIYNDRNLVATATAAYSFLKHHMVTFNYTMDHYTRNSNDEIWPKKLGLNTPTINKDILGLAYKADFLNDKISVTVFGKMYKLDTRMVVNDTINLAESGSNNAYGVAANWFILNNLQLKASYEKAYRLPNADEMLGDGLRLLGNPLLKPESSNNINLGLSFNHAFGDHRVGLDGNSIYRGAVDFIQIQAVGARSQNQNFEGIRITGVDGAIRYQYKKRIFFEANATYQQARNVAKYFPRGSQTPNNHYLQQMPNLPIFFGNADLTFNFHEVWKKEDYFSINISANYMDPFYLYWKDLGSREYKKNIPRQFSQNLSITYALDNGRYNINLECRNILNVELYDYFNIQKPGRAFAVKLRYFFTK